jgi:hypothetical protein
MTSAIRFAVLAAVALTGLSLTSATQAQQTTMSFFVTGVGKGNGADLGGLAGADAHCQALAKAAGSTETNWHAYLSTTEPGGVAGVNARDRIGKGPWQNAKGIVVAKSVEDLHSNANNINKQTALTEQGEIVSGRGDAVNMHRHTNRVGPARALFNGRWRHHLRELDEKQRRIGHCGAP